MEAVDPVLRELFTSNISKGDARRMEIIKTAVLCIAEDGFQGGTLEKIAKRLGIRRSHVAYYYPDREPLFDDIIAYITATLEKTATERMSRCADPIDRLIAMSDAAFEWAERHPEQAQVFMFFYYNCTIDAKKRLLAAEVRKRDRERVLSLVRDILVKEQVSFQSAMSLEDFASALQAVSAGFLLDYVTAAPRFNFMTRQLNQKAIAAWVLDTLKLS